MLDRTCDTVNPLRSFHDRFFLGQICSDSTRLPRTPQSPHAHVLYRSYSTPRMNTKAASIQLPSHLQPGRRTCRKAPAASRLCNPPCPVLCGGNMRDDECSFICTYSTLLCLNSTTYSLVLPSVPLSPFFATRVELSSTSTGPV
jgi:hypothetical protein